MVNIYINRQTEQALDQDGWRNPHQHQTRPEAAIRHFRARAAAVEVDLGKLPLLAHLRDLRQSVGIVAAKLPVGAIDIDPGSRPHKTSKTGKDIEAF